TRPDGRCWRARGRRPRSGTLRCRCSRLARAARLPRRGGSSRVPSPSKGSNRARQTRGTRRTVGFRTPWGPPVSCTLTIEMTYLRNLWDDREALGLEPAPLDLLRYRSNLLGEDLRITNFGGGNTSSKFQLPDPLTGAPQRVMAVKGSGGDLRSIGAS